MYQHPTLAMYNYELFRLSLADVERLAETMDAAEYYRTLGQWYLITAPTDDYVARAHRWLQEAVTLGDADAKLHLATLYRFGDLGKVDMDEYRRLLGEAIAGGSQLAEMRHCRDIAYGVGQEGDLDRGLEEARRRLAAQPEPDPRWYDIIGWMLLANDDSKGANEYFLKAIAAGYVDSYIGLTDMPEKQEEGRRAGCGGSCILIAEELVKRYDNCSSNDANAVECFSDDNEKRAYLDANHKHRKELSEQIEGLYEEAVQLGEPLGLYYRGMLYHDALLGHLEDDDKAWQCFMRGNLLGEVSCMAMLAAMILEGRAPEEYRYEDACFFQLKALRFGDDDQLEDVVHAWLEGELQEYADEIETLYKPRYDALRNVDEDDDPEDDDGRFDAWA